MRGYYVTVRLWVEDDDADGALATAQTILTEAGGTDTEPLDSGDDHATFGFELVSVEPREER